MNRCYVCRRQATTRQLLDRNVCNRCANALPRVLELESSESVMVEALLRVRSSSNDVATFHVAENALRMVGSVYLVDLAGITRVLSRICAVLEPTAGKGHALETLKEDHQRTVGAKRSITYACIMPGCEVCAVVGAAQEMLKVLTDPPQE